MIAGEMGHPVITDAQASPKAHSAPICCRYVSSVINPWFHHARRTGVNVDFTNRASVFFLSGRAYFGGKVIETCI